MSVADPAVRSSDTKSSSGIEKVIVLLVFALLMSVGVLITAVGSNKRANEWRQQMDKTYASLQSAIPPTELTSEVAREYLLKQNSERGSFDVVAVTKPVTQQMMKSGNNPLVVWVSNPSSNEAKIHLYQRYFNSYCLRNAAQKTLCEQTLPIESTTPVGS